MTPQGLLARRHRDYARAEERHLRALEARAQAEQRVHDLERDIAEPALSLSSPMSLCSLGHRYRGKRCPICTPERAKTAARGYGGAWQRLSLLARRRQPWCSACGSGDDLTTDHLDPTMRSGLTLADVVVLCRSCNSRGRGDRPFPYSARNADWFTGLLRCSKVPLPRSG
jgi:5-methylcytosine-specific restriction endonuclease McrA